ncbi:hypothetical protein FACS1894104_4780 [Actinomycetota bacterium]|nr:hypothetical protein FACS1894104_4780 [Actinomycetota bacterium]
MRLKRNVTAMYDGDYDIFESDFEPNSATTLNKTSKTGRNTMSFWKWQKYRDRCGKSA